MRVCSLCGSSMLWPFPFPLLWRIFADSGREKVFFPAIILNDPPPMKSGIFKAPSGFPISVILIVGS